MVHVLSIYQQNRQIPRWNAVLVMMVVAFIKLNLEDLIKNYKLLINTWWTIYSNSSNIAIGWPRMLLLPIYLKLVNKLE